MVSVTDPYGRIIRFLSSVKRWESSTEEREVIIKILNFILSSKFKIVVGHAILYVRSWLHNNEELAKPASSAITSTSSDIN
jgi:hypothetical protein